MTEKENSFKENPPKESKEVETGDLNYGYDFFPERRDAEQKRGLWGYLTASSTYSQKMRCYNSVHWCLNNSEYSMRNSLYDAGNWVIYQSSVLTHSTISGTCKMHPAGTCRL